MKKELTVKTIKGATAKITVDNVGTYDSYEAGMGKEVKYNFRDKIEITVTINEKTYRNLEVLKVEYYTNADVKKYCESVGATSYLYYNRECMILPAEAMVKIEKAVSEVATPKEVKSDEQIKKEKTAFYKNVMNNHYADISNQIDISDFNMRLAKEAEEYLNSL